MAEAPDQQSAIRLYFVDEAGDPTLFNRRKQVVVGSEGCSTYFMLGLLDVADPTTLAKDLVDLRRSLLADPYFKHVPSMQPGQKKTAVMFHAKDDVPEVRREVFSLLMRHEMRFFAVVRDKRRIVQLVQEQNKRSSKYRYHPNQLYDRCVSRLFRDRLHKDGGYIIRFAKRGTKDRTAALQAALETARNNFRRKWSIQSEAPIELLATTPAVDACLQAADYVLWALQRLYEREEERYWEYVWPMVALVHDVDDVQIHDYGQYYTQRNRLTLAVRKKTAGDIGPPGKPDNHTA
jgi:hypothetical protein